MSTIYRRMFQQASKITTSDDGWEESFNCHTLRVGRVELHVNWSTTRGEGYRAYVSMGDINAIKTFRDLEEGKAVAKRIAIKSLTEALAALGEKP